MSELQTHDPMPVSRLAGSVQPPLDQSWDNLTKLRWHAGVVLVDSGIAAQITTGCYTDRGLFGRTIERPDIYGIAIGNSTSVGFDFDGAWDFLNGVAAGAQATRAAA